VLRRFVRTCEVGEIPRAAAAGLASQAWNCPST
jgi:hypothetical protein